MKEYDSDMIVYNNYIDIKGPIPLKIQQITHIIGSMITGCPDVNETRKLLKYQFRNIKDVKLLAHNGTRYDHKIMRYYRMLPKTTNVMYLDTLFLIPIHINEKLKKKSMAVLHDLVVGTAINNAHNALGDVNGMVEIMKGLRIKI